MSITMTEQDDSTSIHHESDSHNKKHNDLSKRTNFTRSPSLEKIIKFNTYLCSQSFFILPSILAWLKSSQTNLKTYTERTTATIKSAIFNSILYKIIEAQFIITSTALKEVSIYEPRKLLPALKTILTQFGRSFETLPERFKRQVLRTTVYFSFFYIFLQLALCLWALSWKVVPPGLVFMLVCLSMISYANYQCLRLIIIQEERREAKNYEQKSVHVSRNYVRARDILGKRTISNISLF